MRMFWKELMWLGVTRSFQMCLVGAIFTMSLLIDELVKVEDGSSLETGLLMAGAYSLLLISS